MSGTILEEGAREIPMADERRFVYNCHRDSHDLWHVPTGHDTDMAGEAGIHRLDLRPEAQQGPTD